MKCADAMIPCAVYHIVILFVPSSKDLFADLKRYTQSMKTHRGEFANSALHHAWDYAVSYGSQVQAIKLSFDSELMMG